MEEILGLYQEPMDPENPIMCFDEMPYQMLDDYVAPIPVKPGQAKKVDFHYDRKGVCNILMAYDITSGKCIYKITERRTRKEYAEFIYDLIYVHYPNVKTIRLVQDNLNTHSGGSFYETYDAETARQMVKKVEFHYTPKNASWLNMVEMIFSPLSKFCLDKRIASIELLQKEVDAYFKGSRENPKIINWQFDTTKARDKFKRFYKG